MSDACFCDYEPAAFYCATEYTARKEHRCHECGRAIEPGQRYEKAAAKWEGSVSSYKTCSRCVALREHLKAHVSCFCWAHGNMLDDVCNAVQELPLEVRGSGLLFELGRLGVAIRRAPYCGASRGGAR
ncbi:hypothetical protein [Variovorax sp.]|uniref:hypothetical protein n=1 Tax=Variovorax sp. TaxID=1871043 RepID=UPI00137F6C62|nr:hypothetical protein [Variovorax sp.]KAF1071996.1 MAG: hypothetical protein GAK39_00907 [Variovorax sp.]